MTLMGCDDDVGYLWEGYDFLAWCLGYLFEGYDFLAWCPRVRGGVSGVSLYLSLTCLPHAALTTTTTSSTGEGHQYPGDHQPQLLLLHHGPE